MLVQFHTYTRLEWGIFFLVIPVFWVVFRALRKSIRHFRKDTLFPSEGACLPGWVPGVGWSDQWSFWQQGYPGIMITDTAPYRYPHYHTAGDTPEKIDYARLARVVQGLVRMVTALDREPRL